MQRPSATARSHRGLRAAHTIVRIVLAAALVVLLALIAVHELRGLSVLASGGRAAPGPLLPVPVAQALGEAA